jgi:phosphatidylglycerol---prolipoprotein diacylglyceryl transferase
LNFPVVIELGSKKILLHAVLEVLAYFIAFRYFLWLRKKQGDVIPQSGRIWIIIAAIFGSLIGSRIIGGLEDPLQIAKADNVLLYFYFNKTVLGGFLGGLFAVELVKKIIGEKNASGDLFTYPMILGLMIGRMGCFSMGVYEETYGVATTFFTGMNLGDGQLRHPVTLYEIMYLLLLWMLLVQLNKQFSLANGAKFKIFMMSYCLFRFLCDFIKPHYTLSIGLSTIQVAALMGMIWYLPYLFKPKKLLALQPQQSTVL